MKNVQILRKVPPVNSEILVDLKNIESPAALSNIRITYNVCYLQLLVTFVKFYDPDIEHMTEKYDAIEKYEYAVTDNSVQGKTYMKWTNLAAGTYTTSGNKVNLSKIYIA